MSLTAFTNEPGSRYLYDVRVSRRKGRYFSNMHDDTILSQDFIRTEKSVKPYAVQGNHVNGTNYYREVGKVISDDPVITHEWFPTDVAVEDRVKDVHISRYISVEHGPFNYVPDCGTDETNALHESQVRALNQLGENRVALGASLGESRQVIDMFASNATKGLELFRALKVGDWNRVPKILKISNVSQVSRTAADLWLEYVYGWKPLAQDIHDTYHAAVDTMQAPHLITGVGKGEATVDGAFPYGSLDWSYTAKTRYRTKVYAEMSSPTAFGLNRFGLINPASIAWELLPWSFAIDWFAPVGAVLDATTAGVGLTSLGSLTSNQRTYQLSSHVARSDVELVDGGQYKEVGFSFTRNCFADWPTPQLYADLTPFSTPRARNALALFRQII